MEAEVVEALQVTPVRSGQGATGRAAMMRAPVQLSDIQNEQEFTGTKVRPLLHDLVIDLFWPFRSFERGVTWAP
jgi:hypothetical protein